MSEVAPLIRLLGLVPPPPPPPAEDPAQWFAEGFAAGEAAAEARLAELMAGRAADLALQAEATAAAADALLAATGEALADAGLALAGAVLGAEPAVPSAALQSLVTEALAAAPAGGQGVLHVPAGRSGDLAATLPEGWDIREDAALAPGAVRAEIGPTAILASLEARLRDLGRRLATGA
jgi:flagellar biosynthesis/type III secretory pathway protein FliH